MKKFVSLISCLLILSFLLQPLISFSPIFAEEIKMDYTDPNHLHAPKVVNGVSYEYDANGNLISDGERTIEWNEDNLPVKITKGDTEIKFYYDANGTRIAKEVKDATTSAILSKTIYINQYYQLSVIGNQSSVTKYYFAQGRRIATTQQQFTSHQQPVTNFYHHDHLGSTILATDLNSQPLSNSLAYFPYGSSVNSQLSVVSNQLSLVNKYLYTGQELDAESDLYNYNARLYNPKTGVFISADSVGGGNRYAYANNNPMMFTDPTGYMDIAEGGGDSGTYLPLIMKNYYDGPWFDALPSNTPLPNSMTLVELYQRAGVKVALYEITKLQSDEWYETNLPYWNGELGIIPTTAGDVSYTPHSGEQLMLGKYGSDYSDKLGAQMAGLGIVASPFAMMGVLQGLEMAGAFSSSTSYQVYNSFDDIPEADKGTILTMNQQYLTETELTMEQGKGLSKSYNIVVGHQGGRIVAFSTVSVQEEYAYMGRVYVSPEARGQGIWKDMVLVREETAMSQGAKVIQTLPLDEGIWRSLLKMGYYEEAGGLEKTLVPWY